MSFFSRVETELVEGEVVESVQGASSEAFSKIEEGYYN